MSYNINIREESFGATLNNVESGKREYITKKELSDVLKNKKFFKGSVVEELNSEPKIKFTALNDEKPINFSFADIVFIELTRACNLNCKHCLNNSGKPMQNQLNYEEIKNLIIKLANCGLQEVRLTGGEPLLFPQIYEIIKLCRELGLFVSIGTNGTLINENVAKKLKDAGLNKAVVSIDGNEDVHDEIRGPNTYKKALNGLKLLKENGIKVRINTVIMKNNMNDVINFSKKIHELEIPMFIRRFIESGRGENLDNNMLTASDYKYVKEQLQNEINQREFVNGHYLRNDEGIHSRIELPFEIKGCKAGQRALAIMPDGEIHLCGFLAAQGFPSVGNVREIIDWRKFWKNLQELDKLYYLRERLEEYNSLNNVQETYCLAYIQRYINKEKK